MGREDVVRVLRRCRLALVAGGAMLDLQVIPPEPLVEVDGSAVCSLEDGGLLDDAAIATAAVDDRTALRHSRVVPAAAIARHLGDATCIGRTFAGASGSAIGVTHPSGE